MDEMLTCKNLSFSYNTEEDAVFQNVSLSVKEGEVVLLMGPSGCGKSTLAYCLSGLYPQYSGTMQGEILFEGESLSSFGPAMRSKKVSILFQNPDDQFCMNRVDQEVLFALENINYEGNMATRVQDILKKVGLEDHQRSIIQKLSGGMEQKLREDAIYKFSNGSANILVATDLASRGLDIPDIDNIIHYHLPIDHDSYVHRIGRTARWENSGNAYFILGPEEHLPDFVPQDLQTVSLPDNLPLPPKPLMSTIYIGKGKKDKISKGDILGFLCKKGGLTTADIGRIDVAERYAYAAVKTTKVKGMLNNVKGEKIKGLKTIIEPVK